MNDQSRPGEGGPETIAAVNSIISPAVAARLSKPGSHAGIMQRRVLRLVLEHAAADLIPTNGRFVFYELEGRGIVRKSRQGESRWQYATTVLEFVRNAVDHARINPWDGEPPLLLVESRSLAGVLYSLASDYLCPIAATNGQVGGFLHTDVVPTLRRNDRAVLYLGDWDLAGQQIEDNTRLVLEKKTGRSVDWTRIAITQEQIDERNLEPVWKTDSRYTPPKTHYAWETEALGQGTIVQLVRDQLDWLLPEPLEDVLEKEREQQEQVADVLADLEEVTE
jgi:hypothetical protein